MTKDEIMDTLKSWENEKVKKMFMKHGAREPFNGEVV